MFQTIYHLQVFAARIEGINNQKLVERTMEGAEDLQKRKDQNPSATGFEDSPLDPYAKEVKQLRETIKRTIHNHIDPRA